MGLSELHPRWRVYYGDGSTFTDEDGPPESAPKADAQYIRQRCGPGDERFEHVRGEDYYCWDADRWIGRSHSGWWQYLLNPGAKVTLFGYELPHERWNEIAGRAIHDADFGGGA